MIDERSRRRANFDREHAVPIRLADGQEWWFPKPWIAIRPEFRDGQMVRSWSCFVRDQETEERLAAIPAAGDDGVARIAATLDLAAHCLRHHYDLMDADLAAILVFAHRSDPRMRQLQAILDTIAGRHAPRSLERWSRLTFLVGSLLPPVILLEDRLDLLQFLQTTGRTIPARAWAEEAIALAEARALEDLL